jgi:hypothetical protein
MMKTVASSVTNAAPPPAAFRIAGFFKILQDCKGCGHAFDASGRPFLWSN